MNLLKLILFLSLASAFQPQTKAELQAAVDLWISDNETALETIGEINNWDTSLITDMSQLFCGHTFYCNAEYNFYAEFNEDINNWDVSNVTNMSLMFREASSFNQDLTNWDVSSVTDMGSMFSGAVNFNGDISSWDVSNVTNMSLMFREASSFNQDLTNWNVSNVTDMRAMFSSAVNFNQDLTNWDVSNVTDMGSMFSGAVNFNGDISSWDVSSVTDMGSMFSGAVNFNQDLSSWDISNVSEMTYIFNATASLSDDNKCTIDIAWHYNSAWPYDWSELCVYGCIDPDASNYNPEANVDDSNCVYCEDGYLLIEEACYNSDDLGVLQEFINNSAETINMEMDDNGNGIIEPLELGDQVWSWGDNKNLIEFWCGYWPGLYIETTDNCDLSGEIPVSIGNLENLSTLQLVGNEFTGEIPESIGQLTNLNTLEISRSQIEGNIPESIINMEYLQVLGLNENNLSGQIPEFICQLENLISLALHNNNLTGSIPECIGDIEFLDGLWLFSNHLSGEIPESIGNLNYLGGIDIGNNNLTGSIPLSFSNSENLSAFFAYNNNFSGEFPANLLNSTYLEYFDISGNMFHGDIPHEISNLPNLNFFAVNDNNFTSIPESIFTLNSLIWFWANNNEISELPEEFCDWEYDFSGATAPDWTLTELEHFRINNNSICPPYPECIEEIIGQQNCLAGCTDIEADNYNQDAGIDDDSCLYCSEGQYFDGEQCVFLQFYGEASGFEIDTKDPVVEMLSPNGPDILAIGSTLEFIWEATDDTFDETPITITYPGSQLTISNSGSAEVVLPDIPTYEFNFSITATDHYGNSSTDLSDETFVLDHFGCMDELADNINEQAVFEDGSCEYSEIIMLYGGNTLMSFPGLPKESGTELLMQSLESQNVDVNFIIGQGVGLFNTCLTDEPQNQLDCGWSGNLNNVNEFSGYWMNVSDTIDWDLELESYSDTCLLYSLGGGNNLISYVGVDSIATIPQLGGNTISNIYNFIIGQGVGLFNTPSGWSGNLNYLRQEKGYWLNVNSSDSIEFRWSIGDDCEQPYSWNEGLTKETVINIPDAFRFVQSTEQAFYLIKDIYIDGQSPQQGDMVLAYHNDMLVGSVEWIGKYTPVPVMGRDMSPETEGFCEVNDIPSLKLFKAESGDILDLNGDLNGWASLGVYTVESLTGTTIEIPEEYVLHPAYPNPFNPITTISFELPIESRVKLEVYNIKGESQCTLEDNYLTLGNYTFEWNASEFSSGLYFVKLTANDFTQSQKLLLIK